MADQPAPNIAKGETEVQIDTFNQWMRGQPFYQNLLRSWGQDPGHPHNLSDSQKTQIVRAAQSVGAKIDESNMEVDDNGNFRNQGHKLRNTLIVAGIAAATIATMGAAGVFSGAAGAGMAGGAAGAGAAGAGGAGAAGLGAGTLFAGTGAGAVGAGTAATTAAGLGAAGLGAATYGPTLAATTTVPTAAGTVAGGTGLGSTTLGGVGGAAGAGSAVGGGAAVGGGSSIAGDLLRYAVPTAGGIVGGLIQANAASNASEAQQKYLEEALQYEKDRDKAAIALEGSRYADYSGNIAPYVARGNTSGTRMSSLLGLPASAAPTTTQPSTVSYAPSATSTAAGDKIGAPTAAITTGSPLPRATDGTVSPMVTMQAPDGSTKQVPQDQVQHYQSMGAQVVG